MSRHAFFAAIAAAAFFAAPSAQAGNPQNALILLPVQRHLGMYGLEFEHFGGNTSFYISGAAENPLRSGQPLDLALDLGIRFYPFAQAPRWFFIGPNVGAEYVNDATFYGYSNAKVAGFRVGAAAGLNILLGDIFLISASVGGEYFRDYAYDLNTNNIPTLDQNLRLFYRGGVGFAF